MSRDGAIQGNLFGDGLQASVPENPPAPTSQPEGCEKPKGFFEKHVQPSIDQVEANASEEWKDVARECLYLLAQDRDQLTADDLVEVLETKKVETHNLAALGPIFLRASRAGWIQNTDRVVQSRIPRRHRKITVWKSLLRKTA